MNLNDVRMRITADVAGAMSALDAFSGKLNAFGSQAQKLSSSLGGVFNPLMGALTAGITAVGAATAGLTKQMLDVGGGFELQMAIVQGKASASAEDLARMSAKARELGETLPITATEAAQAMTNLTAAGAGVEGTLAAVSDITKLSVVQNYDLARTSQLVVDTLRNFNMEWSEAGRVGDTFNHVFNNTALGIDQLAAGFQYISPLARHLNMSLEETVTVLGMLADAGLRGEQGATTLRALMTNIIEAANKANSAAAQVFEELGVKLHDAQGNMRDGMDVLLDLSNTSMNAAQSFEIFGTRAFAGGLVAKESFGELGDRLKKLEQDAGNVDKNLKIMLDTFNMMKKAVESAAEETMHVGFAQIRDEAVSVTEAIKNLILEFNSWARESEIFGKTLGTLFGEFNKGLPSVESFRASLKSINVEDVVARFNDFVDGTKRLVAGLMDFANAVPWGFIIDNLGTIAQIILVGWATGKIAAVTAAIVGLSGAFDVLKTAVVGAGAAIADHPILAALAATAAGIASIVDSANKIDDARAKIEEYNAEAERMEQIARDYTDAVNGNVDALGNLPKKYQDLVNEQLKVRTETGKLNEAFGESASIAMQMSGDILRGLGTVEEKISGLSQIWGTGIMNAFALGGKEGVDKFLTQFERLPQDMQDIMRKVADAAIKGAEEIGKAGEVTKTFSDSVSEGIQKALDEYQKYAVEMTAKTKELIAATGINANEAWAVMETDLKAKAQATSKGLVDEFKNPAVAAAFAQAFGGMAKAAGDEMTLRISDALNDVKSAISAISAEARKAIDEFLQGMEDLAPAFQNLQLQQVRETTDSITFMADNGMSKIIRVYDKATGEIKDVSQTIADSGRDSSKAFELAARDIEAAGRRTGTAWTTGAIEPLQRTGETAKTTGAAIGALSSEAVKVADGFKAAIDGIDAAISKMGERMVSALSVAVEGLKTVFEQIGIDSGNSMMTALNRQVEAAIPSLSTTAANAGMSMGQSMGRSLESAMQTSLQNIARAVDAMARRAAAAVPAAAGSGGNVDAAALAAAYAREG